MNTEFNIIKSQHEKTMLDMNKMIQSIIGSMQYSKELIEDNYSYRWVSGTNETPRTRQGMLLSFYDFEKTQGLWFYVICFFI